MDEPLVDPVADAVWAVVQHELAPLRTRLALVEAAHTSALAQLTRLQDGIPVEVREVRERLVVLETRAPVPGPVGPAGRDGLDGLGVDDLTLAYDGERALTVRAVHGERVRDLGTLELPVLIYRGVWSPGQPYVRGDVVTHGGAAWHCQAATATARPETTEGAACWRLMVKRGDRGKDAPR